MWLEGLNISGTGKLAKAVGYALNEKQYLYTFLENGNIPIDIVDLLDKRKGK